MTGKSMTLPDSCSMAHVRIQDGRGVGARFMKKKVRQERRRDVGVVLEQVPFRHPQLGPEGLREVRQTHVAPARAHQHRVARPGNRDFR
jgi:hypothetical protein